MILNQMIGAAAGLLGIFMLMFTFVLAFYYPLSALGLLLLATPLLIKGWRWAVRTKMPSPLNYEGYYTHESHATAKPEPRSPFHLTLNGVPAHFTDTEPRCPMCRVEDRRDEVSDAQRSLVVNSLDD